MNLATVNSMLELASLLNEGTDYQCTFELLQLPAAGSLRAALEQHFDTLIDEGIRSAHPACDWHIDVRNETGSSREAISQLVLGWMFGGHCSPDLGDRDWVRQNVVSQLSSAIEAVVGRAEAHAVYTRPPIWYEARWDDLALSDGSNHWLLHFGFTD